MKQGKMIYWKLLSVVFWLLLWQAASIAIGLPLLLPPPLAVLLRLKDLSTQVLFWKTVAQSCVRVMLGFLAGAAAGSLLAALAWRFILVRELLRPAMGVIRATPVASFIILALVWVKSGWLSVLCSFVMVLPVVYHNVYEGIGSVSRELLEMAQVFHLSRWKKVRRLYLPAVTPFFLSAVASGMGFAWKSGIAAEVLGHPAQAIGSEIYNAKIYLETTDLFAWTVVVILLSVGLERLLLSAVGRIQAGKRGPKKRNEKERKNGNQRVDRQPGGKTGA